MGLSKRYLDELEIKRAQLIRAINSDDLTTVSGYSWSDIYTVSRGAYRDQINWNEISTRMSDFIDWAVMEWVEKLRG